MRQRWWAKTESQLQLTQYQWRNGKMEKVRVKGPLIFPQPDSSAMMSAGCWVPTAEEWTLKRGLKAATVAQTQDYLTSIEKLCCSVIVHAIFDYVDGDQQAAWWLFEDSEWQAAIPFGLACEVLEMDEEKLRSGVKAAASRVASLGRVKGRKALLEMVRQNKGEEV